MTNNISDFDSSALVQEKKGRWKILLGGFMLSLMGGMSYSWGSFVVPLVKGWGWTTTQAMLPFTILIIVFAVTMIPAGWLQDRIGPRRVALVGSALFLIGYILSGLLRWFPYPGWLIFSYGFIVGAGCGLTYSSIAPTARKWYPDRPGFAVSTGVMGFGLAAVVFSPVQREMIGYLGVEGTFMVYSVFVTLIAILGSLLMKNPSENYNSIFRASEHHPTAKQVEDVHPSKFIRTSEFYILWFALAMVIGGGLTAIGLIPAYGEIALGLEPTIAATAVSAYALTNGLGRPVAGLLSDRIGTFRVMTIVYVVQATVFIILPFIATDLSILIVCALLLGCGYATTFALFPVLVSSGYGTKYLGINYGMVFSAFGIGALTSLIGSRLLDITDSFTPAFLLAGITTVIGLVLLRFLRQKNINREIRDNG